MSFINKEEFRQALIDRQITTQFFNPRERHEIGCIIEMLDNTVNADVADIVRCKYCQYSEYDEYHGDYYCRKLRSWCNGEFYCAYGEEESE